MLSSAADPPAVLWHSLFVDSTSWGRLRPRLAEMRTLILIDGPGHGPNPARAGHLAPLFDPHTADVIVDFWSNAS